MLGTPVKGLDRVRERRLSLIRKTRLAAQVEPEEQRLQKGQRD